MPHKKDHTVQDKTCMVWSFLSQIVLILYLRPVYILNFCIVSCSSVARMDRAWDAEAIS